MGVKTYDPNKGTFTYGGNIIGGYADGTFLTVAFNADAWTLQTGTDGEGTRSKSNNRSGRFVCTLNQSSDSNKILNAIAEVDDQSGAGALPAQFKIGNTTYFAETAWIVKKPDSEFARESSSREWIIETDVLVAEITGL